METGVGIRELRQNLSRYLERVKAGDVLVVTERGTEVARVLPSGGSVDPYAAAAQRFGASVPTARLEDVVATMGVRRADAGTTDRLLAEGRRERR